MPGRPITAVIIPAGILLASGALGMFLQIAVFGRLRRAAKRSAAAWDDILTNSLRVYPLARFSPAPPPPRNTSGSGPDSTGP